MAVLIDPGRWVFLNHVIQKATGLGRPRPSPSRVRDYVITEVLANGRAAIRVGELCGNDMPPGSPRLL